MNDWWIGKVDEGAAIMEACKKALAEKGIIERECVTSLFIYVTRIK